jgi:hypothetical protein
MKELWRKCLTLEWSTSEVLQHAATAREEGRHHTTRGRCPRTSRGPVEWNNGPVRRRELGPANINQVMAMLAMGFQGDGWDALAVGSVSWLEAQPPDLTVNAIKEAGRLIP